MDVQSSSGFSRFEKIVIQKLSAGSTLTTALGVTTRYVSGEVRSKRHWPCAPRLGSHSETRPVTSDDHRTVGPRSIWLKLYSLITHLLVPTYVGRSYLPSHVGR